MEKESECFKNDIVGRITRIVEQNRDEMVKFLKELIQIDSQNPPGNYEKIADFIEQKCVERGLYVRRVVTPENLVKSAGQESPRINLLAYLHNPSLEPVLSFLAHLDTIPVYKPECWDDDPLSGVIKDGRIYGRGACDSKGRIACYLFALLVLKKLKLPGSSNIVVAMTADEECGGELGTKYLSDQNLLSAPYSVVEGYNNKITDSVNSVITVELCVKGKIGHSSVDTPGINAIVKAASVIEGISDIGRRLSILENYKEFKSTVNIGSIKAGLVPPKTGHLMSTAIIPDECNMMVNMRATPGTTNRQLISYLMEMLESIRQKDPELNVEIVNIRSSPDPALQLPESSNLIQAIKRAVYEVTGRSIPVIHNSGGCNDGIFLRQKGIEAVTYGPGSPESNVHMYNENLTISLLTEATAVCAVTAVHILDGMS